jgi:UDP-2,3-diacylglucosamine pyrophosphatase LpxH
MVEYGLTKGDWPDSVKLPLGDHAAGARPRSRSYRSIWISDLHLGTRRCRARELHEFLSRHEAENLYLVGDIVDGWVMGPTWYWSPEQGAVVEKITAWHRRGVRVIFLPGNHDELSTDLAHALFGPLPIATQAIHRTAEGRRMLVIHGHQFDGSLNPNRLLGMMGTQAYHAALRIDGWCNANRVGRGQGGDASLSASLKDRLNRAVRYLTDFGDRAVFKIARRHRADGVICGHTHKPELRRIGPIDYLNDGDWVRSCTALVEKHDGALRLLWRDHEQPDWVERDEGAPEALS